MEAFARLPVELQKEVLSYGTVPEAARPCPGCKDVIMFKRQPRSVEVRSHVTSRYKWFCPRCLLIKYGHKWKCCNPVKMVVTQRYVDRWGIVRRNAQEYDFGSIDEEIRAFLDRDEDSNVHVLLCHQTVLRGLRTCACYPEKRA